MGRRFEVSLWCVREWLVHEDLPPRQRGVARLHKLGKEALRAHPDALVHERAAHFGVCYNAVWRALKAPEITPKKMTLKYKERDLRQRMVHLQALRHIIQERGSVKLVNVDETGFAPKASRRHGWSERGRKVHGEQADHRWP